MHLIEAIAANKSTVSPDKLQGLDQLLVLARQDLSCAGPLPRADLPNGITEYDAIDLAVADARRLESGKYIIPAAPLPLPIARLQNAIIKFHQKYAGTFDEASQAMLNNSFHMFAEPLDDLREAFRIIDGRSSSKLTDKHIDLLGRAENVISGTRGVISQVHHNTHGYTNLISDIVDAERDFHDKITPLLKEISTKYSKEFDTKFRAPQKPVPGRGIP